jgi:arylsulfatase A-like enzyme
MFRGNERIKDDGHATDLFAREARRFINKNSERPFFLYLPFNAPHAPSTFEKTTRQAPEKYLQMYGGGLDWKTQYKALITHLDDAIGGILQQVKDLGLDNNTLVLFASDNGGGGGASNGPLRGEKGSMFEGGLRVPLVARWPGRIPKDRVCEEFTTTLELFPTLLATAGSRPPDGVKLDGFNMLPILERSAKSQRREMFWYRTFTDSAAARVDDWKWVNHAGKEGLYDLATDIGEKNDLSREKPEVLAMIKARYAAWQKEMEASEPRGPFRDY